MRCPSTARPMETPAEESAPGQSSGGFPVKRGNRGAQGGTGVFPGNADQKVNNTDHAAAARLGMESLMPESTKNITRRGGVNWFNCLNKCLLPLALI